MKAIINYYGIMFTLMKDEEYEKVQEVTEAHITQTTPTTISVKADRAVLYDLLCILSNDFDIEIV